MGNLDTHEWTNAKVYAPIISIIELITLTPLAIHHKLPL